MAVKKQSTKQSGSIVYLLIGLFGLPFALVGLLCDIQVLQFGLNDLRVQFWKETPCTILLAELKEEQGSDSVLYSVKAKYQYNDDGVEHLGTRVTLMESVDNQKSYHERIQSILEEHRVAQKHFPCYVNPSDPSQSVLFKDSSFLMIALQTWTGLLFSAIGFGLISVVMSTWLEQRRVPAEPTGPAWNRRPDWAAGEIRHSDRRASRLWIYCSIAVLLIGTPGAIVGVRALLHGGNPWAGVGLIPIGLGLLLLKTGLGRWIRWQRYGDSIFQLATVPGVVGGSISGIVRTERSVDSDEGFRVLLTCTETSRSSSDGDSNSSSNVLWEDEQTIAKVLPLTDSDGIAIPVMFAIPYDQPESNDDPNRDEVK